MSIADQTEEQLIREILLIYTSDQRVLPIAQHIAIKLRERRTILRERRKAPACPPTPSKLPVTVA
jgi:hypothetical protein